MVHGELPGRRRPRQLLLEPLALHGRRLVAVQDDEERVRVGEMVGAFRRDAIRAVVGQLEQTQVHPGAAAVVIVVVTQRRHKGAAREHALGVVEERVPLVAVAPTAHQVPGDDVEGRVLVSFIGRLDQLAPLIKTVLDVPHVDERERIHIGWGSAEFGLGRPPRPLARLIHIRRPGRQAVEHGRVARVGRVVGQVGVLEDPR